MSNMKASCLIIMLLFSACTASKQLNTTHKKILSVSFFSRGSGTDHKTRAELDKYLANWQAVEKTTLGFEQLKWGREGEVDYCVGLESIPKGKLEKFIDGVKQLVGSSDLVRVTEVDVCKH